MVQLNFQWVKDVERANHLPTQPSLSTIMALSPKAGPEGHLFIARSSPDDRRGYGWSLHYEVRRKTYEIPFIGYWDGQYDFSESPERTEGASIFTGSKRVSHFFRFWFFPHGFTRQGWGEGEGRWLLAACYYNLSWYIISVGTVGWTEFLMSYQEEWHSITIMIIKLQT